MANSLDRGLQQALSDLEADQMPAPEQAPDGGHFEDLERGGQLHFRKVEHDIRSLKRGARRMWVAMGVMIFFVAGSIALNLMN